VLVIDLVLGALRQAWMRSWLPGSERRTANSERRTVNGDGERRTANREPRTVNGER
jgi:hypothetical protein